MLELELTKSLPLNSQTTQPKRGLRRYGKLLEDSDFGIGRKPKVKGVKC